MNYRESNGESEPIRGEIKSDKSDFMKFRVVTAENVRLIRSPEELAEVAANQGPVYFDAAAKLAIERAQAQAQE